MFLVWLLMIKLIIIVCFNLIMSLCMIYNERVKLVMMYYIKLMVLVNFYGLFNESLSLFINHEKCINCNLLFDLLINLLLN